MCVTMFFYGKVKMILLSIRTFWYKGSTENKEKWEVQKMRAVLTLKNSSQDSQADLSEKFIIAIWRLILRVWHIILNI